MEKIKDYIKLIRLKHCLKNILIFLPVIFSGNIFNIDKVMSSILAFIAFTFAASFVYVINDYRDIENDKNHPIKKNRPLASGKISKKEAILLASLLILLAYGINVSMLLVKSINLVQFIIGIGLLSFYILLNIAYSFGLKNKPIIDVAILVSGYLIRVLYGAAITSIEISNWLYLTVISASFYMGLGKRRNEIMKQGDKSRAVLKRYSKEFLDKNMYVCLALSIVFYSLWCVDSSTIERMQNNLMVWTVPIIMLILMKYSLDVEGDSFGDPIEVILKDKVLVISVVIYAIIIFSIMYLL